MNLFVILLSLTVLYAFMCVPGLFCCHLEYVRNHLNEQIFMVRALCILWLQNQRFATESFALKLSSEISIYFFFYFLFGHKENYKNVKH